MAPKIPNELRGIPKANWFQPALLENGDLSLCTHKDLDGDLSVQECLILAVQRWRTIYRRAMRLKKVGRALFQHHSHICDFAQATNIVPEDPFNHETGPQACEDCPVRMATGKPYCKASPVMLYNELTRPIHKWQLRLRFQFAGDVWCFYRTLYNQYIKGAYGGKTD